MKKAKKLSTYVISVLIAVFLWMYVIYMQSPEIDYWINELPVTIMGSEAKATEGYEVIDNKIEEKTVDVKVRGKRKNIAALQKDSAIAYIDLSGIEKEGDFEPVINVKISDSTISVIDIKPKTSKITIVKIEQKQFAVEVEASGTPKEGTLVDSISPSQSAIIVRGPKEEVSKISKCVASISLDEISGDFKETVKLKLLDKDENEIDIANVVLNFDEVELSVKTRQAEMGNEA